MTDHAIVPRAGATELERRIFTVRGHRVMLVGRLDALEKKYDSQFRLVLTAVRALMAGERPENPRDRIGFK